jgi:phosphohistidine phosphatase SixA
MKSSCSPRLDRRLLLAGLGSLGALPASGFGREARESAEPERIPSRARAHTVVLVRHAEKAGDDPRDPSLSEAGALRARLLARTLAALGVTHLFCTEYRRTRLTLEPLMEATGLEIETYDGRSLEAIAEKLRGLAPDSVAVVAGHSNTTPQLAVLLGGKLGDLDSKGYFPDEAYDRLVLQTLSGCGEEEPAAVATLDLRYGS